MGRARPMKSAREPGDLPERKVTALRLREGPSVVGQESRTERTNDLTRRAAEVIFVEDCQVSPRCGAIANRGSPPGWP